MRAAEEGARGLTGSARLFRGAHLALLHGVTSVNQPVAAARSQSLPRRIEIGLQQQAGDPSYPGKGAAHAQSGGRGGGSRRSCR